ncbi:hypothetical protein B0T22DRAFT_678 [Podospora appendiculata]|uniref:DUF2293 domain-containing protein n=1 Tax=Podospora appendiculata TaxID=314037 RepID=A0AAE0XEK5_9PEZI|nr:hypothetical protein B0T22DRAFT_678 [Podospora appendiculata]
MPTPTPREPQVPLHSPMPPGYVFVPKGNVYLTKNCRLQTHAAHKPLYVVISGRGPSKSARTKVLGLRCPKSIFTAVEAAERASASTRASAVQKRDATIEETFEKAILELYPRVPRHEIPRILKHALKKNSRRVGRTVKMDLQHKVRLAVKAHIRHNYTNYDNWLKEGVGKSAARERAWVQLCEIARAWGDNDVNSQGTGPKFIERKRKSVKRGRSKTSHGSGRSGGKEMRATGKMAIALAAGGDFQSPGVRTRRMTRDAAELAEIIDISSDSDEGAEVFAEDEDGSSDSDWSMSDK